MCAVGLIGADRLRFTLIGVPEASALRLQTLVEGFLAADIPNARLDIYGPGDYVEELEAIAHKDSRVFYGGMLLNTQIVEKEQEATLLVNPRPTHEEFVKFSFQRLLNHSISSSIAKVMAISVRSLKTVSVLRDF